VAGLREGGAGVKRFGVSELENTGGERELSHVVEQKEKGKSDEGDEKKEKDNSCEREISGTWET